MLSIRLARVGRANWPAYRLVVQERTRAPRSKVVEILGSYDPKSEPAKVVVNKERVDHWIKAGARPTVSAAELLIKQDLLKLEQVPEVAHERKRRDDARKRVGTKRAWKEQVAKEIKKRNEAKQAPQKAAETPAAEPAAKAQAKPAADKPKA
jgi:small subunit ribosomal protein S16